jgi:hypothetical protein
MDNETTMPALLTQPAGLHEREPSGNRLALLYRLVVVGAVLALMLVLCLF